MRVIPLSIVLSGFVFLPTSIDTSPPRGFTAESGRTEREWEAKFATLPDPSHMREAMRRLSARPHHVGSPYDKENAQWILAQFKSYGWDARIESFDVLFPTPKERVVELVAPTIYKAKLEETTIANDPTSGQHAEQLPPYVAYSIDGDVTGPLVFVNYGVPADYEELDRHGISVKGAIVIAKYGGSWRGIKPKVAAEHGAIGCLIYSDPRDDGYAIDDVFPKGPMRPAQGVQRGSVADMPTYPGDPLTPGIGATKNAKRLQISEAKTLTKIPTLPISYGDAQPLLSALRGSVVPAAWRGGLPITYRFGPGPAKVHLRVKSDWSLKTINDVIAKIPGTTEADQWIIRGNHEDAWVNGAQDPISGLVSELEEARALGTLYSQGWRPKRTIIYAAWDGEEPGLLGSTEWVETHADELAQHAVAYINSDTNSRGYFGVEGSHSLEKFINGVGRDVVDPETKLTVNKRDQLRTIRSGRTEEKKEAREREDQRIDALGSGSDYSSFLDHAGVPALNLGFGGEDNGGIYHSIYDDFYWFTHFSDSSFVYGKALSQAAGIAVMRLASADLLPFAFTNLAETSGQYVKQLKKLRDSVSDLIAERNRSIDEGVYAATSDPRDPSFTPAKQEPPPQFDFAPLDKAVESLDKAAEAYDKAYASALSGSNSDPSRQAALRSVNGKLLQAERMLTSTEGLSGRPWYRHLLYAPGFYTGYGVKTMPGVREAIEQHQWTKVEPEIARVSDALSRETKLVGQLAEELERLK